MVGLQLGIVADDFTGANDACGRLAGRKYKAWVSLDTQAAPSGAQIAALNSRSRLMQSQAAFLASQGAWEKLACSPWWYQKIDSTLRGNPSSEILGLLAARAPRFIAVCPAYPQHGRTMELGRLKVHGADLMRSEYARDPLSPAKGSDLNRQFPAGLSQQVSLKIVSQGTAALSAWLKKQLEKDNAARIFVFDAVTDKHLQSIVLASLAQVCRAFAGASGLAGALADQLWGKPKKIHWPAPAARLVLAGSVSQKSLDQLQTALDADAAWMVADRKKALSAEQLSSWAKEMMARGLCISSVASRDEIARRSAAVEGPAKLKRIAQIAIALGAAQGKAGVMLTGGHMAETFFDLAGLEGNWILGELEAGLPAGLALGLGSQVAWVASKPGGFGTLDLMARFVAVGAAK